MRHHTKQNIDENRRRRAGDPPPLPTDGRRRRRDDEERVGVVDARGGRAAAAVTAHRRPPRRRGAGLGPRKRNKLEAELVCLPITQGNVSSRCMSGYSPVYQHSGNCWRGADSWVVWLRGAWGLRGRGLYDGLIRQCHCLPVQTEVRDRSRKEETQSSFPSAFHAPIATPPPLPAHHRQRGARGHSAAWRCVCELTRGVLP